MDLDKDDVLHAWILKWCFIILGSVAGLATCALRFGFLHVPGVNLGPRLLDNHLIFFEVMGVAVTILCTLAALMLAYYVRHPEELAEKAKQKQPKRSLTSRVLGIIVLALIFSWIVGDKPPPRTPPAVTIQK